jgi:hypothetical protein
VRTYCECYTSLGHVSWGSDQRDERSTMPKKGAKLGVNSLEGLSASVEAMFDGGIEDWGRWREGKRERCSDSADGRRHSTSCSSLADTSSYGTGRSSLLLIVNGSWKARAIRCQCDDAVAVPIGEM